MHHLYPTRAFDKIILAIQVLLIDLIAIFAIDEVIFSLMRIKTIETDSNTILVSPFDSVDINESFVYLVFAHDHLLGESI